VPSIRSLRPQPSSMTSTTGRAGCVIPSFLPLTRPAGPPPIRAKCRPSLVLAQSPRATMGANAGPRCEWE
jgi:hypothetical protein